MRRDRRMRGARKAISRELAASDDSYNQKITPKIILKSYCGPGNYQAKFFVKINEFKK
ncbi:MAG: hypothetical protein ACOC57_07075 [Acidobacteriota bacterium]